MTKLSKPVSRETGKKFGNLPVIVTLAPAQGGAEALIGLRLKGRRTQYIVTLSDIYRLAARWHAMKEFDAKRSARKQGTPWRIARKQFNRANRIP